MLKILPCTCFPKVTNLAVNRTAIMALVDSLTAVFLLAALIVLLVRILFHDERDPAQIRANRAASALHKQAWGKPWPRHTGTMHSSELGHLADDDELYFDDGGDDPAEFLTYNCLEGVRKVMAALSMRRSLEFMDVIVVREEYDMIRNMVENGSDERAFVVTGQSGIGKTAFLIYLLISRLEQKLSTAFQLQNDHYVVFDKRGVHLRHNNDVDPLLEDCWALTDSTDNVRSPCIAFQEMAVRVIQTTPPEPDKWKEWQKYCTASMIVMDLPKVLEIGAVFNLDTASTLPIVGKWGPSLRSTIHIARNPSAVRLYSTAASSAASMLVPSMPSLAYVSSNAGKLPTNESSAVLFIRPQRRSTGINRIMAEILLPTKHLSTFLDEYLALFSAPDALKFFEMLSSHAIARPSPGWTHEMRMHRRFCNDSRQLRLYAGQREVNVTPPDRILCGSQAALKQTPAGESCYWMPSVDNFPGIDGVFVDGNNNNVFALQATVAKDYSEPHDGLRRVWRVMSKSHQQLQWHFVLVCDSKTEADKLLDLFVPRMIVGGTRSVDVWACVLD